MTRKKSIEPKKQASKRKLVSAPTGASIPSLPIPDFDPVGFTDLCRTVETRAEGTSKLLVTLLRILEDIKNLGATEALAQSERVGSLADVVAGTTDQMSACLAELGNLHTQIDTWESGERRSRRARFEQIARHMEWKIVGSWPEPVVNGIVFISIDEEKDRCTVNGRVVSGSLTAERLALAAVTELGVLLHNLTDPGVLVAQIWKACATTKDSGIPVHDLLRVLTWQRQSKGFQQDPRTDLYRGYSLAQFRADLTHCLAAGKPSFTDRGRSYSLEIVGGSFAQDGIFMYFPHTDRLATCGRLAFQPLGGDQDR